MTNEPDARAEAVERVALDISTAWESIEAGPGYYQRIAPVAAEIAVSYAEARERHAAEAMREAAAESVEDYEILDSNSIASAIRALPLPTAPEALPDAQDKRIAELEAALRFDAEVFESIRLKLIKCLEEPNRSAFWTAVRARDACRAALAGSAGGERSGE